MGGETCLRNELKIPDELEFILPSKFTIIHPVRILYRNSQKIEKRLKSNFLHCERN